jgi:heme-degrading monooxygenase HmoA
MGTEQADRVLELVVFRLKEGATREQLLGTVEAVSEWAEAQPGFISRDLCYSSDDDRWIDVVYWRTLDDAVAAATAAESSEACAPMFELIDLESMLFLHGVPVTGRVAV